jgi:hypothetical protein
MALSHATLTAGSDTSNVKGATAPYTTASVTLTSGRGYVMFINTSGTTGDPTLVETNGAALQFQKEISQVNGGSNFTAWYINSAGSTVTAVINITLPIDGSSCMWYIAEYTGHNTSDIIAQSVKTANTGQTSIAQTLAALASSSNHQLGGWTLNDNDQADVPSGTDWVNIGNGTTVATPSRGLELAQNTAGAATQLTGSGSGSLDREMIILEIAAAAAAAGHPAGRRLGLALPRNTLHGIEGVRIL